VVKIARKFRQKAPLAVFRNTLCTPCLQQHLLIAAGVIVGAVIRRGSFRSMGIELDAEMVPSPILSSRRDQSGPTIFNDFDAPSALPSLPTTCEHRDALTAGQSTLSAAIPLFGHLIPLLGWQIPLFDRVGEFRLGYQSNQ
jgi:hypothetical protein